MKCPICGQELRPGKKDPNYLLCYNCKKKFKAPAPKVAKASVETEEQKFSNIPPKSVREKREAEMKKAYDEMLAADDTKKKKRKEQPMPKKQEEVYDDVYDDEEDGDEEMSMIPVIILGIAIVAVTAVIIYMMIK